MSRPTAADIAGEHTWLLDEVERLTCERDQLAQELAARDATLDAVAKARSTLEAEHRAAMDQWTTGRVPLVVTSGRGASLAMAMALLDRIEGL